jgi:hypothetical protein
MEHLVAVRTYWPQMLLRINLVFLAERGQRKKVVNVNKALPDFAVPRPEIEIANGASGTIVTDARESGRRVPFIGVHHDGVHRAFGIC